MYTGCILDFPKRSPPTYNFKNAPKKPWREEARDRDAPRSATNVDPPLVFFLISNPRDASYAHSPNQDMNVSSLLILHKILTFGKLVTISVRLIFSGCRYDWGHPVRVSESLMRDGCYAVVAGSSSSSMFAEYLLVAISVLRAHSH